MSFDPEEFVFLKRQELKEKVDAARDRIGGADPEKTYEDWNARASAGMSAFLYKINNTALTFKAERDAYKSIALAYEAALLGKSVVNTAGQKPKDAFVVLEAFKKQVPPVQPRTVQYRQTTVRSRVSDVAFKVPPSTPGSVTGMVGGSSEDFQLKGHTPESAYDEPELDEVEPEEPDPAPEGSTPPLGGVGESFEEGAREIPRHPDFTEEEWGWLSPKRKSAVYASVAGLLGAKGHVSQKRAELRGEPRVYMKRVPRRKRRAPTPKVEPAEPAVPEQPQVNP